VITSDYRDNPFLTEKFLAEVDFMRENDPVNYRNVYLGEPISGDTQALIRLEWFEAALDAHTAIGFEGEGVKVWL
jgi:phage terminase large subunit